MCQNDNAAHTNATDLVALDLYRTAEETGQPVTEAVVGWIERRLTEVLDDTLDRPEENT